MKEKESESNCFCQPEMNDDISIIRQWSQSFSTRKWRWSFSASTLHSLDLHAAFFPSSQGDQWNIRNISYEYSSAFGNCLLVGWSNSSAKWANIWNVLELLSPITTEFSKWFCYRASMWPRTASQWCTPWDQSWVDPSPRCKHCEQQGFYEPLHTR